MNSLVIIYLSGLLLLWGYFFYAHKLNLICEIDPRKTTPAISKCDGIDYVPAKNWFILFGHHFSSIAGAGPIIGPTIAIMYWGWLPALIWIVLGAIFVGGVHDFTSLAISVKEGGKTISEIARVTISQKAKIIFSIFVWLSLILVIAVFAYLCAETFTQEPKIVLPSLGLIPIAVLVGWLTYYGRKNFILITLVGIILFTILIYLGQLLPIKADLNSWLILLFVYSYFASILPVHILLQPRDYISAFLLFFAIIAGYLGAVVTQPKINMPFYQEWNTEAGSLLPMLFVTIACGAISGFHALIASGTTSKQIANERHIKRIGYGAMLMESLLSILVIICVASLFTKNDNLPQLLKNLTPIGIFVKGYNKVTERVLFGIGKSLAFIILNSFIITTLDTATRIARYITEELFTIKNRFFSTLIVVALAMWLSFGKKYEKIWIMFGASNQLVSALTLFVVSCWLIKNKKSIKFTLLPSIFMFIITLLALSIQIFNFYIHKEFSLLLIACVLVSLSLYMFIEAIIIFKERRKNRCQN